MEEKKNTFIKFFITETEELFIKSYLQKLNDNLSIKNNNNKKYKPKSLSEFIREIVLNYLIQKNNIEEENLFSRLEKIEKISARTLTISYRSLEKIYSEEEAKNILDKIIEKEKKSI